MGNEKRKKVTAAEIAREANVSPATVSRVMNQKYHLVTEETVQLVHETMQRLGYEIPQEKKQIPITRPIIIFNVPGQNLFYNKVIEGAIASANAHGCQLLIHDCPLDQGTTRDFLELIGKIGASGVIIMNHVSAEILMQLSAAVPVVQCSEYNTEVKLPYVSIDDRKAAYNATRYLIERGRNKIALLNGPESFRYARDRRQGYQEALQDAGLSTLSGWITALPDINYEMAYSAVCQMLNSEPVPNAFFAVSDTLATAVIKAASRFQYRVPQDIFVIGFDNTGISYMCTPSITTVSQPAFQEGFTSCELLIKLIHDPGSEVNSILLETELIVRETT